MRETNRTSALLGGHALRRGAALLLALLLMLCGISVSATTASPAVPDPTNDYYVYDAASVLSAETEKAILERNADLDSHYGIQIIVMTVTTLGGGDWEKYAQDVYAAWEIGGVQNRGLLLVLYTADDQYWSIAGALGPNFTDDGVGKLLGEYLEPSFAEKDYDTGVLAYFNAAANLAEQYISGETASSTDTASGADAASSAPAEDGSDKDDAKPTSAPSKNDDKDKSESKHPFLKFLAGLFTVILILAALAAAAFAVIYIRGQMIRRKRQAQRSANRRSRSGSSSGGSDSTPPPANPNDDYKSFSDRY